MRAGGLLVAGLAAGALAACAAAGGPEMAAGGTSGSGEPPNFGFNENWFLQPGEIAASVPTGADSNRTVLSWRLVEPLDDRFRWQIYDRVYGAMIDAGTRPLWVLHDAPCWTRPSRRCGARPRPPGADHVAAFGEFAAQVARRYPGSLGLEVWNEPNNNVHWRPEPDPTRFAAMLTAANGAVDGVAPEMPVVLGGLAPVLKVRGRNPDNLPYPEFLVAVLDEAGPAAADAVAIHPFPGPGPLPAAEQVAAHLDRVRTVLDAAGAAGMPIWVTEVGLSTAGAAAVSAQEQADGLVEIYRELRTAADVPVIVVHRFFDQTGGPEELESGWGIVRRDGTRKPAFFSLALERLTAP